MFKNLSLLIISCSTVVTYAGQKGSKAPYQATPVQPFVSFEEVVDLREGPPPTDWIKYERFMRDRDRGYASQYSPEVKREIFAYAHTTGFLNVRHKQSLQAAYEEFIAPK